jgi:hypothetical protein
MQPISSFELSAKVLRHPWGSRQLGVLFIRRIKIIEKVDPRAELTITNSSLHVLKGNEAGKHFNLRFQPSFAILLKDVRKRTVFRKTSSWQKGDQSQRWSLALRKVCTCPFLSLANSFRCRPPQQKFLMLSCHWLREAGSTEWNSESFQQANASPNLWKSHR